MKIECCSHILRTILATSLVDIAFYWVVRKLPDLNKTQFISQGLAVVEQHEGE